MKTYVIMATIVTEEKISKEDVLKSIEEHYFSEGELFDINGTDAIFNDILIVGEVKSEIIENARDNFE